MSYSVKNNKQFQTVRLTYSSIVPRTTQDEYNKIFEWCEDNFGEYGVEWNNPIYFNTGGTLFFGFNNKEDMTLFVMTWK